MEAEEFDTSAAFFNAAVSKNKKVTGRQTEPPSPARQRTADGGNTEDTVEELDPAVLQVVDSWQSVAHEMAHSVALRTPAIDLFTKAIMLDPAEFRYDTHQFFFLDRCSFCCMQHIG
ncbi:hypothetical protein LSAT2_024272 [Lamellibrachia satsuma]|nr:hypothetical protein LSAT2_024272 [Lamellibrachia satsuma]